MDRRGEDPNDMTFLSHLRELRRRVVASALAVLAAFAVLLWFSQPVVDFVSRPLAAAGARLYFFRVQEALVAVMEACFWAAVILASPVWTYQAVRFVAPALDRRNRLRLLGLVAAGAAFLAAGFAFSYLVLMPASLRFLLGFGGASMQGLLSAEHYLDFFLVLFFMTGLVFQTPLAMLFLARLGIIDSAGVRRYRKAAIVAIFAFAAVVTPPDVVSQLLVGVPMYALFELGALLCLVGGRRRGPAAGAEAPRG